MVKTVPIYIKDAYIIEYPRFSDDRGFLEEIYNDEKYPDVIRKHYTSVKQNTLAVSHQVIYHFI